MLFIIKLATKISLPSIAKDHTFRHPCFEIGNPSSSNTLEKTQMFPIMSTFIQRNGIKIENIKLDFVRYRLILSSPSGGNIDSKFCLNDSGNILFFKSLTMQRTHSVPKIGD